MARPQEYTEDVIIALGEELINCANSKGVYHITEFSEIKKKCPTWVYEVAREYPVFSEYLKRARNILGRKIMRMAIEESPSLYMQKTFIKRYLNNEFEPIEQWVKEDVQADAQIKAEAVKAANISDVSPTVLQLLASMDEKKNSNAPKS